jgi:hypothetical protein
LGREVYIFCSPAVSFISDNGLSSSFVPIPALNRTDADVQLLALYNYAVYTSLVTDPWFEATRNVSNRVAGLNSNHGFAFLPNNPMGILGLTEQHQFCTSVGSNETCTLLTGIYSLKHSGQKYLTFSDAQNATALLIWSAITYSNIVDTVLSVGARVLAADQYL